MSPKNYFFLLFTFYFESFTKSKIKTKGKRQCGLVSSAQLGSARLAKIQLRYITSRRSVHWEATQTSEKPFYEVRIEYFELTSITLKGAEIWRIFPTQFWPTNTNFLSTLKNLIKCGLLETYLKFHLVIN